MSGYGLGLLGSTFPKVDCSNRPSDLPPGGPQGCEQGTRSPHQCDRGQQAVTIVSSIYVESRDNLNVLRQVHRRTCHVQTADKVSRLVVFHLSPLTVHEEI